ncbi:hypothetical protein AMJ49_01065 [Parcubacteria bacterium DG_74_2]|nr:MAG: hypothetical protein AMJ49_01065 [Parcubacteria bacterium DG_74_2]
MISFEEFKKLDLRVAKVIKAENVEGSKNLMRMEIDLGNEKRQIVAGISQFYKPEDLIGKEIIVIANLEPKTLFGLESKGMLLAAEDEKQKEPVLLIPDKEVPLGTKIC